MKGMVFTIDALFALALVVATVPLIVLLLPTTENNAGVLSVQTEAAIDALTTLSTRSVIREPAIAQLYEEGVLTEADLDRPIIDVISDFWASNTSANTTRAYAITQDLLENLLPESAEWSLALEGESMQSANTTLQRFISSGKRVASGFRKGYQAKGYIANLFLTTIESKKEAAYYFFGGFVGQGNLTVQIENIPSDANVSELYLELNAGEPFNLSVNNVLCATLNSTGATAANSWTFIDSNCIGSVSAGTTNISINFTGGNLTNEYIGGGFLRLSYTTAQLVPQTENTVTYRFPGMTGILNIYDGFSVPGNITEMNANITFFSGMNYSTTFWMGNATIMNHSGTNSQVTINISNATFRDILAQKNITFLDLSGTTVPLRLLTTANLVGGTLNATSDVVLITDVSGSMAWRLNQDSVNGNTINNCDDPNIYLSTTSRISLAKCLDKIFVNVILGGNTTACGGEPTPAGNRVGLVSFSTSANTWESLTTNVSYLESRINAYSASGGTCISCAINRAAEILAAESNASRTKYIVLMTDGVANYRSTNVCFDLTDVAPNITAGLAGATLTRTPAWVESNNGGSADDMNGIGYYNQTTIRAGASGGGIYQWNGVTWVLEQDTGNNDIYGIALYNQSLGFAVGASAKIWRWNGVTWAEDIDLGNFDLRDIAFFNASSAVTVGASGRIYVWNSTTWNLQQDVGSSNLYSLSILNTTFAFAGGTSGKIYSWNGATWAELTDTGSNTHNDVVFLNKTKTFTASSDGRIYEWNGNSWTSTSVSTYPINGVYAVDATLAYAVGDGRGDVYEWNGNSWTRLNEPFYYNGTSTSGITCGDDDICSLSMSSSYSSLNANFSAAQAKGNDTKFTIDAIGFGPITTCTLGNTTIHEIAKTGNGTAYVSANATELQNIYCLIAQNIITKQTQTQQVVGQGVLQPVVLYPNSTLTIKYVSSIPQPAYQEVSVNLETPRFAGCDGSFFYPQQVRVVDAKRTSYSGFYWTEQMTINNSGTGGYQIFYNLSKYAKQYSGLGDPFSIMIPISKLRANETNTIRNELGLNNSVELVNCSGYDRIVYTARVKASVPTGNVFPTLAGSTIRVYYDEDYDGTSDGFTDVALGEDLPSFNPTPKTTDQLVGTQNALEDAFLRLLTELNFVTVPGNSGVIGTSTNPIDVKPSDIGIGISQGSGVPFTWGPIEIRLDVKR